MCLLRLKTSACGVHSISHGVVWLCHRLRHRSWRFLSGSSTRLVSGGCPDTGLPLPCCRRRRRNCRCRGRCQRFHHRDTGSVWGFNLIFADDVKLPPAFRTVIHGTYLLDVLNSRVRPGLVFDQQILPRFRVLFGFCAFRQANLVVFLVVLEPVLLPGHGGTRVFFVDSVAVVVVVVAFAVSRWIIPVVIRVVP